MAKDQPSPTILALHVLPGASNNEVVGEVNGVWKVRLIAPPIEGRANRILVKFLADKLRVNFSQIILCQGEKSRRKSIAVFGLSAVEITQRLTAK